MPFFYHQNCATRLSLIAIQVQCQLLCSDETNYPEFGKTVLSCWFWHNRNMDYNIHGSGGKKNKQTFNIMSLSAWTSRRRHSGFSWSSSLALATSSGLRVQE